MLDNKTKDVVPTISFMHFKDMVPNIKKDI
jgi:hypothetical protein